MKKPNSKMTKEEALHAIADFICSAKEATESEIEDVRGQIIDAVSDTAKPVAKVVLLLAAMYRTA